MIFSVLPSGSCASMVTSLSVGFADVTFVPVITLILSRPNDFASSADTASSSFGTMRGNSSMSVTWLPKRL